MNCSGLTAIYNAEIANGIDNMTTGRSTDDDDLSQSRSQSTTLSRPSKVTIRDKIARLENAIETMKSTLDELKTELLE